MRGADDRIIETQARVTPGQVLGVLLLGCVVGMCLGSAQIVGWTEALPEGPAAAMAHDAAVQWNAAMSALGAPRLHAWLRGAVRLVEGWRFS